MEQKKEFTGVWIPKHIIEDGDLSMTDKIIFAEIACFETCFKSNESLGKRYNLKKNTISIVVSKLIKKGYVESNQKTGDYRQLSANYDKPNQRGSLRKIKEALSEKSKRLCDYNHTIDNSIDNKEDNKLAKQSFAGETSSLVDSNISSLEEKKEKETSQKKESVLSEISPLIDFFSPVNPTHERLFSNKTQRASIERLLKKFSFDELSKIIQSLSVTNKEQYAPTVTTPLQLEVKLGQLKAYWDKRKNNKKLSTIL